MGRQYIMAVHAIIYLILSLLVTACGPQLQRPAVSRELIERERELQKETALRVSLERLEQLNRVSTLLKVRAAEFCENRLEPLMGTMWASKDSFPEETRAVAARIFKLEDENLRILSVIPGGAAANAGLKPGDTILKINGNEISPPATFSNTPLTDKVREIIRKAAGDPLEIEILREGAIKSILVTTELGCRSKVRAGARRLASAQFWALCWALCGVGPGQLFDDIQPRSSFSQRHRRGCHSREHAVDRRTDGARIQSALRTCHGSDHAMSLCRLCSNGDRKRDS
jgi:PDZ domain